MTSNLGQLTVDELVARFVAIVIQEDKAEQKSDQKRRNALRTQMFAIVKELKSRPGDQRRALLPFYSHPNIDVRLQAAHSTLAIAPKTARRVIEDIANSNRFPHAGEAGMTLSNLDSGFFVPD
jgi:hypothetical protein